jgi:hypothetical protein
MPSDVPSVGSAVYVPGLGTLKTYHPACSEAGSLAVVQILLGLSGGQTAKDVIPMVVLVLG